MIICVSLALLVGCGAMNKGDFKDGEVNFNNRYLIEVAYDEESQSLQGNCEVNFINKSKDRLDSVVFHLYANAYKSVNTAPAIGKAINNYPNGFNEGYIDIESVKFGGKPVEFSVSDMVLTVVPKNGINSGDSAKLSIDFKLKIPESTCRMGYLNGISQFTNWYPILAIYDEGWQVRPYYKIGESNYSEVADYEVKIKVEKEQVIATTGYISGEIKDGAYKEVTAKAENVRDFAFVCSKDFIMETETYKGIDIHNYYRKENGKRGRDVIPYVKKVFDFYEEKFGEYPYNSFSVAETFLSGGGMEYPQLITLGQGHYDDDYKLEHVIAHEGAHQWWYVTVGSDEYSYPWMDEGFATYSTDLYFNQKKWVKPKNLPDLKVNSAVIKYNNWSDYNKVSYKMGAGVLWTLQKEVGDERFFEIMKDYYKSYKFKNASAEDFLNTVEVKSGDAVKGKILDFIEGSI